MKIDSQGYGPECFQVEDQFLLSASDDGTVRLYDFSPLSRGDPNADGTRGDMISQESEELRIRRSNRRLD
jgi:WD40 repeat protein